MSLVSVIIPVKNGEATLEQCLKSIFNQSIAEQIEVIVLDSGSTDASHSICAKFPVRVVPIVPSKFNHGLTRNYGVSISKGEFIYFTVQDAIISDIKMLEHMASHFNDKLVQGVVGIQATPSDPDKNPAVWFKRISIPKLEVRHFPENEFKKLSNQERFLYSNWDNVVAMYRRKALLHTPFKNTNFSEDWMWAHDALNNGFKIIRDPSLVVYHYHHQSFKYVLKEQYIVHYSFHNFFQVHPKYPDFFGSLAQAFFRILKKKELTMIQKLYWMKHNIGIGAGRFAAVLLYKFSYLSKKEDGLKKMFNLILRNKIPLGRLKEQN